MQDNYIKVPCDLTDRDGNAFSIIVRVCRALREHGHSDLVNEYIHKAVRGDYNHLLRVSLEYTYDSSIKM